MVGSLEEPKPQLTLPASTSPPLTQSGTEMSHPQQAQLTVTGPGAESMRVSS